MIIKTIVPKVGEPFQYMGKPVLGVNRERIGSITDVIDVGDHYELIMEIVDNIKEGLKNEEKDISTISWGDRMW